MGVGVGGGGGVPARWAGGAMTVADSGRPPFDVVAIGSSAGGIEALPILTGTPLPDLPAPVLIVQHLHPYHASVLAHLLRPRRPLQVLHALHDDAIGRRAP